MVEPLGYIGVYLIHSFSSLKCQYFHVIAVENEWFDNLKVFNTEIGSLSWAFQSDVLCFPVTLYVC